MDGRIKSGPRLCFAWRRFDFRGGNYARFARDDLAVGIELEIRMLTRISIAHYRSK